MVPVWTWEGDLWPPAPLNLYCAWSVLITHLDVAPVKSAPPRPSLFIGTILQSWELGRWLNMTTHDYTDTSATCPLKLATAEQRLSSQAARQKNAETDLWTYWWGCGWPAPETTSDWSHTGARSLNHHHQHHQHYCPMAVSTRPLIFTFCLNISNWVIKVFIVFEFDVLVS